MRTWSIDLVFDVVENEVPAEHVHVLDEIHHALLRDDARIGIPIDKVLYMIVWYADGILQSAEASDEEKLATFSVIRGVEKVWPTGFKALKGRL